MYTEQIKWNEHVETASYIDTCDMVLTIKQEYRYKPSYTPVRDKKSQIKVGNLAIYLYLYS